MFIGHFALGYAAKRVAPRVSLGTSFFAAQLLDLIWPILLLAGVEHVRIAPGTTAFTPLDFYDYPWSHSAATSLLWAIILGVAYFAATKRGRDAAVVATLVFSHWVLDFATHRPDLPLWPGSGTKAGLGLWNSVPATLVVEVALFAAGVFLYLQSTDAVDRIGKVATWALIVFLALAYAGNLEGTPPPSVRAIAVVTLALWILPLWAWWADRHRMSVALVADLPLSASAEAVGNR